jgi:purine-binding chemotaxis protein CheW
MADINEVYKEFEEDTLKDKYLTFVIDKESYAIEVRNVTEIIGIQPITEIPEVPDYVKGIINLRGSIIPVMDVRLRFKKESLEYNDRTCVIIVDISDMSVGLIVDKVSEVLTIPEENIVDPPTMSKGSNNRYIRKVGRVGDEVKLLLDCNKLLTDDELEAISKSM